MDLEPRALYQERGLLWTMVVMRVGYGYYMRLYVMRVGSGRLVSK